MKLTLCSLSCLFGAILASITPEIEKQAEELFDSYEKGMRPLWIARQRSTWNTFFNPTDENLDKYDEALYAFNNAYIDFFESLKLFNWREFKNEDLKRKFQLTLQSPDGVSDEKYNRHTSLTEDFMDTYSKGKVCDYRKRTKCDLTLEPELDDIFTYSRDPKELAYYWKAWRDVTGKKARKHFQEFVEITNEDARINNFTDNSRLMIASGNFECDTFKEDMENELLKIDPLYKELHAYVRGRLNEYYGDKVVSKEGPIPAQLLGNMWSQVWTNILNLTAPYPDKTSVDVTQEMIRQGYTPIKMFQAANEFFTSLNMSSVPESFWKISMFEKPKDRDINCQPLADEYKNGEDYLIKMCAEVNQDKFITIHHEMGHIQYLMQYKDLPYVFQTSPNEGFHEAIGDVVAMSVVSPKHLKRIGLLPKDFELDRESTINLLFLQALDRISPLPYSFILDKWRWDVYEGKATEEDYNCHYWKLRLKYQGIQPPVERSEEDLDPFAKYHVAYDKSYIRYFVSYLLQYQFHKALCVEAGEFDPANPEANPLYNCDIYKSVKAGEKYKKMLQMGASKPWPIALETLTGTRQISTDDILDYFKPLHDWLRQENKKKRYPVGWSKSSVNFCKKSSN